MSDSYVVRDGARKLNFEGDQLGHVTTRRPSSPRWTELTLYRTVGGSYVFEKIGRSRLLHMPDCEYLKRRGRQALPRFQDYRTGEDPDHYEYDECVPDEYDFTLLLTEEDLFSAVVADDANALIKALIEEKHGKREIPQLTGSVLSEACGNDADLNVVMSREEHIA